MSGPQGPGGSPEQWAPQQVPGDGQSAPIPQQPANPYPADPYAGGGYPAPAYPHPPAPGPAWGPPNPAAPEARQQWGQTPPGQWNPQAGAPGQPYPPQQWGAPQYPAQPGYPQQQFGAQPPNPWGPPPAPAGGGTSKPLMWVGIGLVGVAALVGVGLLASGLFSSKTLDQTAAEDGVEQIVTESYGARSVSGVSCPSGQQVKKGDSFECSLTVDGTAKKVAVTFTDDDGTYEVGRPK